MDLIAVVEAQAGFHHLKLVYKDTVIQIWNESFMLTFGGHKTESIRF